MPIPNNVANKVWVLEENLTGRDFVVGDLHGCYDDLMRLMEFVNFNKDTDRLISVGDLVDRGPDNYKCGELIYEPWFYAVRGNHEQMMIDSCLADLIADGTISNPSMVEMQMIAGGCQHINDMWRSNGGSWAAMHSRTEIADLARAANQLPLVIVLHTSVGRFNVVHAELLKRSSCYMYYVPVTDSDIDNWTFSDTATDSMMWGRRIYSSPPVQSTLDGYQSPTDLSPTFVGHTVVSSVKIKSRQIFIDGGAVFGRWPEVQTATMMMAEPVAGLLHVTSTISKVTETIPMNFRI